MNLKKVNVDLHLSVNDHQSGYKMFRFSVMFKVISFLFHTILIHGAASFHTNEFAVLIQGGDEVANEIAKSHGFVNRGQVGSLNGYYLFEHHGIQKRSLSPSLHHSELLKKTPSVLWVEQQEAKRRVKRNTVNDFSGFPDPLYSDQWFLHDGGFGGYDMNVIPAWKDGFTGKGVVVSILDDGIQGNHPDLSQNYDKNASWDINDSDDDPTPKDDDDNKHGTRCAGEVAATANNEFCGVGIAYNASIGGVRMLDGVVTDFIEATALSLKPDHIHIYSASWGPEDDGKTVDGPGRMATDAFRTGIAQGRGGLGSIYVWASGNGGRYNDNCNCDGYTNSIYTISVSSATQSGLKPWYLEECSSTLTTTYSSGAVSHDENVVTVDVNFKYFKELHKGMKPDTSDLCTKSHTGTSASAPIAAAICALALEANPSLTWRDMQYIIVMTSRYEPLQNEKDWITNGVGRQVSTKFGYGLMDAAGMVQLAKNWKTLPKQHICITPSNTNESIISAVHGESIETAMFAGACRNKKNSIMYLEHVQVYVTLTFHPRGNLQITLISPSGTKSTLLLPRSRDKQENSFKEWPFMSVHFWGENPKGLWKLRIVNSGSLDSSQPGLLSNWTLVFYGTEKKPFNSELPLEPKLESLQDTELAHSTRGLNKFTYGDDIQCKKRNKFTIVVNGQRDCIYECPVGQYGSLKDNACHPCDKSCLSCYGPSYNNCLSCPLKYFLLKNICVKSCPEDMFSDINRQCYPCVSSCATCTDSSDSCRWCKPGFYLHQNKCLSTCPFGTYAYQHVCNLCHESCSSCYGSDSTNCIDCMPGYFFLNGTCQPFCPIGYSRNHENKCKKCDRACETCTMDSSCTKCKEKWEFDNSGNCVYNFHCEQGLEVEDVGRCEKCYQDGCEHCIGQDIDDCLYCENNYLWFNGQCTTVCPDGYFTIGNECMPCNKMCSRCENDENNCLACKSNFILYNGKCIPSCPFGYFENDHGSCDKCHSTCMDCIGNSSSNCTLCSSGFYLMGNTCIMTCPEGYFALTHDNYQECMPCHFACKSCSDFGSTNCDSCFSNASKKNGVCIPCLDSEFYNEVTKSCENCHAECGRCFGAHETECLSCPAPLRLHEAKHICLPCCVNSGNTRKESVECCDCSDNLDVCMMSDHPRSIVVNVPSTDMEVHIPMEHIVPFIIAVCASVVLLFVMVFGLLQAHSVGLFNFKCFRGPKYERVPNPIAAKFDAEMEKVSLTREDLEDEDDIYEKI